MAPRSCEHVDRLDLYYNAVKDTKLKWPDVRRLCQFLLTGHRMGKIKCFTTRAGGPPRPSLMVRISLERTP